MGMMLNHKAVHRWILSRSEHAVIAHQCEVIAGCSPQEQDRKDLDSSPTVQKERTVIIIVSYREQMADPFTVMQEELVSVISGKTATSSMEDDLLNSKQHGEVALLGFVEDRLMSDKVNYHQPIKQVKSKTFDDHMVKKIGKSGRGVMQKADDSCFSTAGHLPAEES